MLIRKATPKDVPSLSAVGTKTYIETFGNSLTEQELEAQLKETRSENYFRSIIDKDEFLIATVQDELIGYLQITKMNLKVKGHEVFTNDPAINAIYVTKNFQDKGVGKALMNKAFELLKSQNKNGVYIDVWEENKRALNFYKSYGFSVVGKCDVIIDGKCVGEDLVLHKKI